MGVAQIRPIVGLKHPTLSYMIHLMRDFGKIRAVRTAKINKTLFAIFMKMLEWLGKIDQ